MKEQQKQIDELKEEIKELKDGSSSSGELSLLGIRREVSGNNYNSSTNYTNISLADLSDGTMLW